MKVGPSPLALEGRKFAVLIRAHFRRGGYHVQFNAVSAEALREAQRRPEEHRGLLVRVAGYANFIFFRPGRLNVLNSRPKGFRVEEAWGTFSPSEQPGFGPRWVSFTGSSPASWGLGP
ncbi:hypothetical protein DRJ58_01015 [Candidatus Acetothermia bacterium]|nr:MAG: hypothetical protein DRJ58_01015 [Candidatus Acetothermia bacterium]